LPEAASIAERMRSVALMAAILAILHVNLGKSVTWQVCRPPLCAVGGGESSMRAIQAAEPERVQQAGVQ
jgi:hypothetical protein